MEVSSISIFCIIGLEIPSPLRTVFILPNWYSNLDFKAILCLRRYTKSFKGDENCDPQ